MSDTDTADVEVKSMCVLLLASENYITNIINISNVGCPIIFLIH